MKLVNKLRLNDRLTLEPLTYNAYLNIVYKDDDNNYSDSTKIGRHIYVAVRIFRANESNDSRREWFTRIFTLDYVG